ncbi:DNA N-6-adenine-methyltransferase [Hyalangium sp.]|uniref:DNA N-6-adenine-methyltransferase n=1 Tax=Hyalangium sp. TaxID=2028555 RepID=UPI0039C8B5C4
MRRATDPRKGVWRTPDWLFEPLDELLTFDLDAAASRANARCARFFSEERSGLTRPWDGRSVWSNPPYGQKPGTDVWVEHGRGWAERLGNRITMLVPVKADTAWYHDLVWGRCRVQASAKLEGPLPGRWYRLEEAFGYVELLELRGRVDFGGAKGPGFFASAVVVYGAGPRPLLPALTAPARTLQLPQTRGGARPPPPPRPSPPPKRAARNAG